MTQDQFLKEVSGHAIIVLHDQGLYRHLRFKRPLSNSLWFDLVTWPGTLCIDGDIGSYIFRRTLDMFQFFRDPRKDQLYIYPDYWSQKLKSTDRRGVMEFSEDLFRKVVEDYVVVWAEDRSATEDDKKSLWDEINEEVMVHLDEGETQVLTATYEFYSEKHKFRFDDLFDHCYAEYTNNFLWCCYAIVWGIKKYDDTKPQGVQS